MKTVLTTSPAEAAAYIKNGGLAAFPTETVYGLGANVFDETAVAQIFEAKRRPADNPLIAHISSLDQVEKLASSVNEYARKFIDHFFPGPLTVVLPKADDVPLIATAGLDTIGVRMPKSTLAVEFLKACNTPVVAPSANLSGKPSPTTWQAVYEDLDGRIDCILQGEITEIGLESTVVDCSGYMPVLLRTGAISLEQLRAVVPETVLYVINSDAARSPGMKHKHYTPIARVVFYDDELISENAAFIGLAEPPKAFTFVKVCDSIDEYARSLFEFFRECDRRGIGTIYCQPVPETGIGAALMDRLRRAAE